MTKAVDHVADTLRACAVGAVGGPIVFLAVGIIGTLGDGLRSVDLVTDIPSFIGYFILIWAFTIMPAVLVGMPLSLLLQRFHITGLLATILIFGICGAVMQLLIVLALAGVDARGGSIGELMVIAGFGAVTGSLVSGIAWLIRRPDRDPPAAVSRSAS